MLVGLLTAGILMYQRFVIESQYKNYEVDFYYSDLEKLAQQEDKTVEEYLDLLKSTGIHNMLIREETVQSLKQNSNYDIATKMDGYDLIIESSDKEVIKWIFDAYNDVKKTGREVILENENRVLVKGKPYENITAPVLTIDNYGTRGASTPVWQGSSLELVGLGYEQKAIDISKSAGYGVVLVPTYNSDFQDSKKSVDKLFSVIDTNEIKPTHIFFSGSKVLGYDTVEDIDVNKTKLEYFAKGLEDRNIALGFIESSSQGGYLETEGMSLLAGIMDYEATGSYLTWDFIQTKFDYEIPFHHNGEEITNIFFRGITTRNIRVVSLKPFIQDGRFIADPNAYKTVLDNLEKRLEIHNIKPSPLKTMGFWEPNPIIKIFVGSGIIAACLIILDSLFTVKQKYLYAIFILGFLVTSLVYVKLEGLETLMSKIYALLGAIAMPTMALFVIMAFIRQIYTSKKIYGKAVAFMDAIKMLFLVFFVCFLGAVFEISMLSHSKYLLGLDSFSGVKFSQMIPMLMAPVVYVAFYGYKRGYKSQEVGIKSGDIQGFFEDSVKIWQVALFGLATGVLLLFMLRSGNTSGEPSSAEALLRNGLEFVFPARPRTKAIFLGIPALLILFYNAYTKKGEKYAWILVFSGSIALVNLVNTFSHTKAPIYLSIYRTLAEIIVGTLVAVFLIIAYEIIVAIKNKKIKGKEITNE